MWIFLTNVNLNCFLYRVRLESQDKKELKDPKENMWVNELEKMWTSCFNRMRQLIKVYKAISVWLKMWNSCIIRFCFTYFGGHNINLLSIICIFTGSSWSTWVNGSCRTAWCSCKCGLMQTNGITNSCYYSQLVKRLFWLVIDPISNLFSGCWWWDRCEGSTGAVWC